MQGYGKNAFLKTADSLSEADEKDISYIFARLHDILAKQTPQTFARTVMQAPGHPLSAFRANYLCAMVEFTAQRNGCRPPDWTADTEPLDTPWFAAPEMKSLRLYLLTVSPPPFRRRNIFVDSSVGSRI